MVRFRGDKPVMPGRALAPTTVVLLAMALAALGIALAAGLVSALFYVPAVYPTLKDWGIEMRQSHSLHTSFAVGWIYLAAVAFVHEYLWRSGGPFTRAEWRRFGVQAGLWGGAGFGIFVTLLAGVYSGREYVEYHPVFSVAILLGWVAFGRNLYGRFGRGFWEAPVYRFMWCAGILVFAYTYLEQHAWMALSFGSNALTDMQVQWKSLGAMVGSFNLLVYGVSMCLGAWISGDRKYAQSPMAFGLFGVGLLNTLTNYAHHTYHLPQSELVKWISFGVSMLEVVILAAVMSELARRRPRSVLDSADVAARRYLACAKWWTFVNLVLALLLSVPPLNTLVHGTLLVVAHSMGTTIGIDTFVLLAALSWLVPQARLGSRAQMWAFNAALATLVVSLGVHGIEKGVARYLMRPIPAWTEHLHHVFALAGATLALGLALVVFKTTRALCVSSMGRARIGARAGASRLPRGVT